MPIFIQSLPLSLSAFWRYLILMPFLAIGSIIFHFASIIPFVGWLVPGMISVWLTVMGLRCALAARGYTQGIDGGTLLTVCLYFSVIFLGVGIILNLFMSAVFWLVQQAGLTIDPLGLFAGLFGASPYWSAALLAVLAPLAFTTAAFAVPLTAAAASTGPRGWNYKAFAGFGQGVIGLMIVMAVWLFSGHIFSIFGEIWTGFGLIVTMIWAIVEGESLQWDTDFAPFTALRGALIMAWASSWYFATAVLTWERYAQVPQGKPGHQGEQSSLTTKDIRDLRRARMRGNKSTR